VMKTFVDGVRDLMPAFGIGLRLPALLAMNDASLNLYGDTSVGVATGQKPTPDFFGTIISLILAIIMMMLALGGVVTFVLILVFRVITLWFLMILSPLAFFLWGVPGRAAGYWGQWLDEFVKHLIVGPVAGFLLYLIIYFYVN